MIGYTKRPAILLETAKMDYYKYRRYYGNNQVK